MQIGDILTPKRIAAHMRVSSRKRMLEEVSGLLRTDESNLDTNAAFQSLVERERLGTTAIGNGVALPHGRVKGLTTAIGAFATLAEEIDCDALDHQPVNIVFVLLVPENAGEEQLAFLSKLANAFSDQKLRERLLRTENSEDLYHALVGVIDVPDRKVS